jgi:hypothetical protein
LSEIALRVYTDCKRKRFDSKKEKPVKYERIFVIDTETTNDEYQNLKFGSFVVCSEGILLRIGLFYNPKFVSDKELRELKNYCKKNPIIKLYTLKEFVEKVFYPEAYFKKALCVGFNLPFDLSRLAIGYSYARGSMEGGFSFKLSENKKFPRIRVKHLRLYSKELVKFKTNIVGLPIGSKDKIVTLPKALVSQVQLTLNILLQVSLIQMVL